MQIQAIETSYKGYRFRSRLEARWAVFFDFLRIEWEYEKEGYDLGDVGWYLPDFWLPQVSMWAEVKPEPFSEWELARCDRLAATTGHVCLLLDGMPNTRNYYSTEKHIDDKASRMDYLIGEGHLYQLTENRFYSNTGASWPEVMDWSDQENLAAAVYAARGARFEHGEKGYVKEKGQP